MTLEFLDFLKKTKKKQLLFYLKTIHNTFVTFTIFCDFSCWLSVKLLLPFELLVCLFASFERNSGLIFFYVIC